MEEFLAQEYFGNTVQQILIALTIIISTIVVGRIFYWILTRFLRSMAERTATKLDDVVVSIFERPLTLILVLLGCWYGFRTLTLPPGLESWLGNIFHFLIILTVAWVLSRLLDTICTEYLVPLTQKTETEFDDQIVPVLRKFTRAMVWVVAIIIALDNVGYDVGALLAGLGIGGLALAMAAKDTVANFFGGFTIFLDKPFTLNDRVQVSGYDGFVREVGLRSTRIETLEGRIVTIPNAKFTDSPVENVSLEPSRKVVVKLGLTYETTTDQMNEAMQLLKDVTASNSSLEEKVLVSFTEFGDSSVNLLFIYYIKPGADILEAQCQVNLAILENFTQAGLEFAFPTQTIYTKAEG